MTARQSWTRVLCALAVVGWALRWIAYALIALMLYQAFNGEDAFAGSMRIAILFAVLWLIAIGAQVTLRIWRRCDRCGGKLFASGASLVGDKGIPDYRAKQFLGSFERGAVLEMARTGSVNCLRCGHRDGANPDYIVRSGL